MRSESRAKGRAVELFQTFAADESGQDLVEYTLLVALMGSALIIAWHYILSSSISTVFLTVAKQLLMLLS